jgi:hypothetical protein
VNTYRIYLNNNNLADVIDISADYPIVMGNLSLFYKDQILVASIPSGLVFIKTQA